MSDNGYSHDRERRFYEIHIEPWNAMSFHVMQDPEMIPSIVDTIGKLANLGLEVIIKEVKHTGRWDSITPRCTCPRQCTLATEAYHLYRFMAHYGFAFDGEVGDEIMPLLADWFEEFEAPMRKEEGEPEWQTDRARLELSKAVFNWFCEKAEQEGE